MEDDQQFCLRWNNHQSTLVSVFDTLLEKGIHVDCTLAAEGQTLRAHKVVLSACSPYFESVLSQQYDKHPIIILKDVKYAELRAMMDYMYRGEVNISQDQLGALLKAAESLQIKGLSDNKPSRPPSRPAHSATTVQPRAPSPQPPARDSSIDSREGSASPARRRKKLRRSSLSPPAPTLLPAPLPTPLPAALPPPALPPPADPPCKEEAPPDCLDDLTMEDEGVEPPAHPNDVVRNFQWHMDRSQDDMMNSGEGGRESQVGQYYSPYILSYGPVALGGTNKTWTLYECMDCGNKYKHKGSLQRHIKYECRKQPSFKCPYCVYRAYQKHNLLLHERHLHKDLPERVDFVTGDQDDDANDVVLKCEVEYFKSIIHTMLPITPMKTKNFWTHYEMSYECEKCKRKYRHKSTYRRHVTYECGKEPMFRCPFLDCTYKAYQKTHTDAHIKTKHKILALEYK